MIQVHGQVTKRMGEKGQNLPKEKFQIIHSYGRLPFQETGLPPLPLSVGWTRRLSSNEWSIESGKQQARSGEARPTPRGQSDQGQHPQGEVTFLSRAPEMML